MTQNRPLGPWARRAALGCILPAAWACTAGQVKMDHDNLTALKDAPPIRIARYEPPAFAVQDPSNAQVKSVSGMSGGVLVRPGRGAGDAPMEIEYALDDPAAAIADQVFDSLSFELGVRRVDLEEPPLNDDGVEAVARAVGREGWLFDVKTLHWGIAPDPKFWTRYLVRVKARGRLIDLSRARVVWQAACDGSEGDAPRKSVLGDLTADDAALLKERLTAAAGRCAEELVAHLFGGVR